MHAECALFGRLSCNGLQQDACQATYYSQETTSQGPGHKGVVTPRTAAQVDQDGSATPSTLDKVPCPTEPFPGQHQGHSEGCLYPMLHLGSRANRTMYTTRHAVCSLGSSTCGRSAACLWQVHLPRVRGSRQTPTHCCLSKCSHCRVQANTNPLLPQHVQPLPRTSKHQPTAASKRAATADSSATSCCCGCIHFIVGWATTWAAGAPPLC